LKLSDSKKTSSLLRDTTHLGFGQGSRLVIQAVYFILVARMLGAGSYGEFASMIAMVSVFSSFSSMGAQNLIIKNIRSNARSANVCFGNGLMLTTVGGVICSMMVLAADMAFRLKISLVLMSAICVSDLLIFKYGELVGFGLIAVGKPFEQSLLSVLSSCFRLAGIGVLALSTKSLSLSLWVYTYTITGLISGAYAFYTGRRSFGRPEYDLAAAREDLSDGLFFSLSSTATTIYNDIDKVMLGKLADFQGTGIYAAAYRVIDVSLTPVRSLAQAAYPKFFEKGTGGVAATSKYANRLIGKSVLFGAGLFVVLYFSAPLMPHILGDKFQASISALRWLALIPLLRCIHVFLADALSGAGHQRIRSGIQVFVAILNVGANFALMPRYSWRGAAWASLACDGTLALVFWLALDYLVRRERHQALAAQ
jgi:O-antigen/teichoic acid export membrane protein